MKIVLQVNGKEYETESETIAELLGELNIIPEMIAVEVNLKIIKKSNLTHHRLKEGDIVEVVNLVGGG